MVLDKEEGELEWAFILQLCSNICGNFVIMMIHEEHRKSLDGCVLTKKTFLLTAMANWILQTMPKTTATVSTFLFNEMKGFKVEAINERHTNPELISSIQGRIELLRNRMWLHLIPNAARTNNKKKSARQKPTNTTRDSSYRPPASTNTARATRRNAGGKLPGITNRERDHEETIDSDGEKARS